MSAGYELLSPRAMLGSFASALEIFLGQAFLSQMAAGPFAANSPLGGLYPFLGHVPTMKPKVGPPQPENLRAKQIAILNAPFHVAMAIPDEVRRRDQTGQFQQRVAEFGEAQGIHFLKLASELLADSETLTCFTGQPFHSASHVWGDSGTQSNLLELSAGADFPDDIVVTDADNPPVQAVSYAFRKAIQQLRTFKSDQGVYMNMFRKSFMAVCSSKSFARVDQSISLPVLGGGELNLLQARSSKGEILSAELNPYLDDAFDQSNEFAFLVCATDSPRKCLILQGEELVGPPEPDPKMGASLTANGIRLAITSEAGDHYVLNKELIVVADANSGVGFGDPFTCVKVKITA